MQLGSKFSPMVLNSFGGPDLSLHWAGPNLQAIYSTALLEIKQVVQKFVTSIIWC